MTNLYEKYRPTTFDEVLGQEKAVRVLRTLCDRGIGGKAIWISGQSGQGKTTLAYIVAGVVADKYYALELDASDLTPARLREIEYESQLYSLGEKSGRAYIVNEAHGLRRDTIRKLLVILERIPGHVVWLFTTTKDGQDNLFEENMDAHPLISRTVFIPLTNQGLNPLFAARAQEISEAEGLGGKPITSYTRLGKECRNNMRAMLQAIEAGEMME